MFDLLNSTILLIFESYVLLQNNFNLRLFNLDTLFELATNKQGHIPINLVHNLVGINLNFTHSIQCNELIILILARGSPCYN